MLGGQSEHSTHIAQRLFAFGGHASKLVDRKMMHAPAPAVRPDTTAECFSTATVWAVWLMAQQLGKPAAAWPLEITTSAKRQEPLGMLDSFFLPVGSIVSN
jgi:hypothetical protein